jgi:hypothetical protein
MIFPTREEIMTGAICVLIASLAAYITQLLIEHYEDKS